MLEPEKTLLELIIMGAFIGFGRLLLSSEEITFRVVIGRSIMGSATSLLAGLLLLRIPSIDPLALLAVGSALGIIGQQYIEKLLRKRIATILEKRKEKDDAS